ncbi:hypothetical protein ABZ512_08615 [Nocardiopsis dassonvillei]|uniref:hypothetical protein n=1 Tax=Nocardiopsis dassonvillei TaxID=2014 RepID=UPI0033FFEC41
MLAALARARADAASGAPLTFDLLSFWQRVVLGMSDTPFRSAPAFAKQGRERYGTGRATSATPRARSRWRIWWPSSSTTPVGVHGSTAPTREEGLRRNRVVWGRHSGIRHTSGHEEGRVDRETS